jgi:hypothetical protein
MRRRSTCLTRISLTVISGLVLTTSSLAQAQLSESSEFFFQATEGQQFFTLQGGWLSARERTVGNPEDRKTSGVSRLGARYELGLNQMFSFQAFLSYSSLEIETGTYTPDEKSSGFEDISFTVKGMRAFGPGNVRFGSELTYGIGDAKTEPNGDTNRSSGGTALTPYFGYELAAGPGVLGARLAYRHTLERTLKGAGGVQTKITEGHETRVAAFYEYFLSKHILGARYESTKADDVKVTNALGESIEKTADRSALGFYSRWSIMNAAVIAGFDYIWVSNASDLGLERSQQMEFNIAYRSGF